MIRRLSVFVPSLDGLERIAGAPRLLGLRPGRRGYSLLRETYFDTRDGALAAAMRSLCLRIEGSGRQVLELTRTYSVTLGGVAEVSALSAPVVRGGLYASLAGDCELATAVADLVDPIALRPVVALDIDRETCELRRGWRGTPVCTAYFERVLAHRKGATRVLHALVLTQDAATDPGLETLAPDLERIHGFVPGEPSTVQRALSIFEEGAAARAEAPREVRMALFVLRQGSVALVNGPAGLALPSSRGSGEDIATSFAAELLGPGAGSSRPDLVGFAPSRDVGSDLEVWLVTCGPECGGPREAFWVPLLELMERVGAPGLRDPGLVAALLLLVRSESGRDAFRPRPPHRAPPTTLPSRPRPAGPAPGAHPSDFLDVELSLLAFNGRVLEMAEDPAVPLLERFRFLSIFASNLDEFFGVRVGRLKGQGGREIDADGIDLASTELLDLISIRARAFVTRHYACLSGALLPALAEKGVRLRAWSEIDGDARSELTRRFDAEIFPLLTPQAMDASPGQPFPRLQSLGLSLVAVLRSSSSGATHLSHVPIPAILPRFVAVPGGRDLIAVEEVIAAHADSLFPGYRTAGLHALRVTRMGDVDIDEGASLSLLAAVEDEVEARPYKPVVRIEVDRSMPRELLAFLLRELRQERGSESAPLGQQDVFELDGPLDLRSFSQLAELDIPGGSYAPFEPVEPWASERPIFEVLKERDRLVFHPYESFDDSVGRLLGEAASDAHVVAIKLTLYRTGRNSPFADALLEALRNGKEVSVFVELKARFDEESNIQWTRRLIEAGGRVVYGVVGFKTHAKTALVVRREGDGIRRYVHVGTGNYNAATSRVYTDLSLLSADPELGADLHDFFNELTGSSGPPVKRYRRLLVAPNSLAAGLSALIEREAAHAAAGRPARIEAKLNGLTDRALVRALYEAARQGVEIDLIVRSVCTLRPGVPGLSERIRVRSILGRFLEHARIYYFENGGEGDYYIASADWRKRNLRKRVEVAAPVATPEARARLRAILDAELADPRAWVLRDDGSYVRVSEPGATAQERFLADPAPSLSSGGAQT